MATYCPGNRGDLLVFRRAGYSHYAVNVGNGEIVHVTSATEGVTSMDVVGASSCFCCSPSSLVHGAIAVVKKEPFASVFKPGDKLTLEDGTWKGKTALSSNEIVRRALRKVGKTGYNILLKNCEHFARWCRYGEETSEQANHFGIGLGFAAVLFIGAYYFLN